MASYDTIVIGVGGMGSAALYHLARRGQRVLGLERFQLAHDRGSSHGQTRIIRKAYFEHPAYVPLLQRAYALWAELEEEAGCQLLLRSGLLLAGPPEGLVLAGARRASQEHGLNVVTVPPEEVGRRWPGFTLGPEDAALLEPDGGILLVEDCVRAYAEAARRRGAELRTGEAVRAMAAGPGSVTVHTTGGRYTAAALVLCAGAYSGPLLPLLGDLRLPLTLRRKVMLWFRCADPAYRLDRGCPAFAFDTPEGFFYGFPVLGPRGPAGGLAEGLKVAEHSGGEPLAAADLLDRGLRPPDEAPVRAFLAAHLPRVAGAPLLAHAACMYTMTPDEHFIIDRHPAHSHVVYAAGFSGHGFKFASVVGEVLAELVTNGSTAHAVDFLSARRLVGSGSGDGDASER